MTDEDTIAELEARQKTGAYVTPAQRAEIKAVLENLAVVFTDGLSEILAAIEPPTNKAKE